MANTNDLVLIVKINEDIKSVVSLARRINLLALNAILLARKGGNLARGFGVISDELRTFSKTLTKNMEALRQLSYTSIQTISLYQRQVRVNNLMALAAHQVSGSVHGTTIHHNAERGLLLRSNTLKLYENLQQLLQEADDTSRFGCVISRSLKIEATYGGNMSYMLAQIAADFGRLIDEIPEIIARLSAILRGRK